MIIKRNDEAILKIVGWFFIIIIIGIIFLYWRPSSDPELFNFVKSEIVFLGINLHVKPISVIHIGSLIVLISLLEGYKKHILKWITPFRKKLLIMFSFLMIMLLFFEIVLTFLVWNFEMLTKNISNTDIIKIGPWTEVGPISILLWSKVIISTFFGFIYLFIYLQKLPERIYEI